MTNLFQRQHRLRNADFDRYGRLQPAAVLDLFQDAAAEHAGTLGLGYDEMTRRGLLWVVLRVFYRQLSQPDVYDQVLVRTWPHSPGTLDFIRDYEILAEDGALLVQGTSVWVVIRAAERKIILSREIAFPPEGILDKPLFPTRLERPHPLPVCDPVQSLCSAFCEVDRNGHVNNAKYANYMLNALRPSPEQVLQSFYIEYHHEVLPETQLTLQIARNSEVQQCRGYDHKGTLMFAGQLTFQPCSE